MNTSTNAAASPYSLDHVSNSDLHQSTCRLVGRSNQVLAALLAHLAEVEERGIHRERACTSLYTYCIYELRMSEDAAFRRARAAKIARQFPILFEQIAAGEIHLSGVLMLGPVLTHANHREVLALAKHRTKRELTRLVRLVSPLADARCVVEPLGPATNRPLIDQYGDIRELEPGDRPRDWMQGDGADPFAELATGDEDASGGANMSSGANVSGGANVSNGAKTSSDAIRFCVSSGPNASSGSDTISDADTKSHAGAADAAPAPLLVPQRYMIQFTAPQEYVDLLERAKSLSAYEIRSLVEIHLRAMSAFVSELEKRRCGATSPRRKSADAPRAEAAFLSEPAESTDLPRQRRQRGADLPFEHEESVDLPRQRGESSEQVRPDGSTNVPLQRGESSEQVRPDGSTNVPLQRGEAASRSSAIKPPRRRRPSNVTTLTAVLIRGDGAAGMYPARCVVRFGSVTKSDALTSTTGVCAAAKPLVSSWTTRFHTHAAAYPR